MEDFDFEKSGLTAKQRKFTEEYFKTQSVINSMKAAGYTSKSDQRLSEKGWYLCKKDNVKSYLKHLRKAASHDAIESRKETLIKLSRIVRGNMNQFAKWGEHGVQTKDSTKIDDAQSYAISKIKQTKDGITIELHDKVKALSKLLDHWKGINEANDSERARNSQEVAESLISRLDEAGQG